MSKKRKKILHVVGGMDIGGTETMLMNLYKKVNNDFEFHFISYYDYKGYYDDEITSLGGKVIRLKKHSKLGTLRNIRDLIKTIKDEGPYEVVHAHTLFNCGIAMIAARLSGVKVRISHAHTTLDNSESIIKKIYIKLMRNIINIFSTNKLYCSRQAGEYLFGDKYLITKGIYFPNIIDYHKFTKYKNDEVIRFKEQQQIENTIVLGHIGRFVEAKNHKFLIKILKAMKEEGINVTLLLAGDGYMKEEIRQMAVKYRVDDSVRFLGIRKDIDTILKAMDVFVFPSIYEGLGLVMLEAQASGIPCVVSQAIQPEADLGLGLVSNLSLEDDMSKWINEILMVYNKKINNKNKIIKAFKEKGYSVDNGIKNLKSIYLIQ